MNSGDHHKSLLRTLIERTGLSRRKAFAAIRESLVAVDGMTVVDPSSPYAGGRIRLEGREVASGEAARTYLLMNKPTGVITANADPRGRPTVIDLVPIELRVLGLHPVGRLDLDTTGLLLLTNDGDLTYLLTHPGHEVEKEYWLTSNPPLAGPALERLRRGVDVGGRTSAPARVRPLDPSNGFEVAITIREGRKRQVRRMVEAVGARVTRLMRVREGALGLGGLPEGRVRRLTDAEVAMLTRRQEAAVQAPNAGKTAIRSAKSRSRTSGRRR